MKKTMRSEKPGKKKRGRPKKISKGISRSEFARRQNVTEGAVRKAIASGRIIPNADGTLDPVRADREWIVNTNPSPHHRINGQALPTYLESRALYEEARAKKANLEYEILSGKMVNLQVVKHQARETGRIVKEQLMGIPIRVTPTLMGKLGLTKSIHQHIILETLTREIHQALADLQEDEPFLSRLSYVTKPRS